MKIVGCLILFAVSCATGALFAGGESKRLCVLGELSMLAGRLVCGIEKRVPLDGIIDQYTTDISPIYIKGTCRSELSESLKRLCDEGLCVKEAEECTELMELIYVSRDVSEIEGYCIGFSKDISEKLCAAKKECAKKKELYIKLGVLAGLLVCVTAI